MNNQTDRIQNAINHIKTSVDVDPWAVELAVEALEKELKNSTQEVKNSTDTISRQDAINELRKEFKRVPTTAIRAKNVIEGLSSVQPEIAEEDIREWCYKRCLTIIDNALYLEMRSRWSASAQPERKKGRWKLLKNGDAICQKCGFVQVSAWDMDGWDNFCHHCGSYNGGEQDE